ncbi:MAG TPA: GlsB/YeaQ/YmgE family stress response membrane protein [Pirellulales bacterium]|nr:GlsB/YeaQ/YmgE family stress response membrane protein [Pirellulales bacterium]
MTTFEIPPDIQEIAHDVLAWIGFGTCVGLLAKAIMPGRDPGGAIATLAMGIGGSVIGCGALMYISNGVRVKPFSPIGFVVATAGAFVLLFFYRLLGGRSLRGGYGNYGVRAPYYSSRRRPRVERIIEEE